MPFFEAIGELRAAFSSTEQTPTTMNSTESSTATLPTTDTAIATIWHPSLADSPLRDSTAFEHWRRKTMTGKFEKR